MGSVGVQLEEEAPGSLGADLLDGVEGADRGVVAGLDRESAWSAEGAGDGFFLARSAGGVRVHARFGANELQLDQEDGREHYRGTDFDVHFDPADPIASITSVNAGMSPRRTGGKYVPT